MIMDKNLVFADALDVSAAAGTALVGDVVDLDVGSRRMGSNHNMSLVIAVSTAFASGGAATVQFKLASDSIEAIETDGTETVHYESEVFSMAQLAAGEQIIVPLPAGIPANERYLGLQVVTATATTTAGSINAMLVHDAQDDAYLPDAVN